ncbi:MAG: hypothetical protein K8T25_01115 [Planctomycetia bacterium]|nr:hypothetical protein [Planctomycetia bacterium]
MTTKSPQEKKRLSYKKDRRNIFGENSKSSRKNIRRSKRIPNRANRRSVNQSLSPIVGDVPPDFSEAQEMQVSRRAPKTWKKFPDTTLGKVVERKLNRRLQLGIDQPNGSATKIAKVRNKARLNTK